jgi:UPF0716 family protein affecting phage T7 exclusion
MAVLEEVPAVEAAGVVLVAMALGQTWAVTAKMVVKVKFVYGVGKCQD